MVNKLFREFRGIVAIPSPNKGHLLCIHDYKKVTVPATFVVREGYVYSYKTSFVKNDKFYVVYSITDLSFSRLISLIVKSTCRTLVEFVYD